VIKYGTCIVISDIHGGVQNNGNTKKLRTGICVGYIESFPVCLHCSARVSSLVIVRVIESENGRLV
jgi:predicted acyltransferase (DUF342 family)